MTHYPIITLHPLAHPVRLKPWEERELYQTIHQLHLDRCTRPRHINTPGHTVHQVDQVTPRLLLLGLAIGGALAGAGAWFGIWLAH